MLGISNICKGYKSFVMKLAPNHKHGDSKFADNHDTTKDDENFTISYPTTPVGGFDNQRSIDDNFLRRSLSRTSSRRCKTPTPRSFSRSASRSTTPTPSSLSRNMSRRNAMETEISASVSRNMGRRSTSEMEIPSLLSRNMSRRHPFETEIHSPSPTTASAPASPAPASPAPASPSPASPSPTSQTSNAGKSGTSDQPESLSRSVSKRSTTPIVFSRTTARKKPRPIEKKLAFTLEELCHGCVKKIKITRDVINNTGIIVQEEETLKINVQPGWRKGTKITFEAKGDEKPGYLPADILFLIDEKRHHLFKRSGRDDLEIAVEIPLADALGGCSFPVPLLGGDKMTLSFDDIIYHGYVKVIPGQGMPKLKDPTARGDLRITCLVKFPTHVSDEKRAEAVEILQDCSYD
ncbi:hypothetical protein D8674_039343 [Pyrus ussuriensis x Pyrus communis]|uniref:Chaperone DnaJ C-terminal domain-containing protein n=1 Tax=Pyrus ussuriensis x Pyrus communis TaxID=2448454 RepID=A0A5N5H4Z4_9ROSA|nr:hypothetical protein D8674_039343 [Pyrus ussuriensis x Pyrus communis]